MVDITDPDYDTNLQVGETYDYNDDFADLESRLKGVAGEGLEKGVLRSTDLPVVDVDAFGAEGDGATDDTQAFVDALSHIENTLGKGILSASITGEYRVDPTQIPAVDPQYVKGISLNNAAVYLTADGTLFDIVGSHTFDSDPANMSDQTRYEELNTYVENARVFGADGTFQGTAVGLNSAFGTHIRGCQFTYLNTPVHITSDNRNHFIYSNHIYQNSGYGIFFDGGNLHQCNITSNHLLGNNLHIYGSSGELFDIQVTGNDLENYAHAGLASPRGGIAFDALTNGGGHEIVGNTIDDHGDATDALIEFGGDVSGSTIEANQFSFADVPCIRLNDQQKVGIGWNVANNIEAFFVELLGNSRWCKVGGNICENVGGFALIDGGGAYCEAVQVNDNNVDMGQGGPTPTGSAAIQATNTRMYGSSVSDNYVRARRGVWGIDLSLGDYFSGSRCKDNSVNCSSSSENGIRVTATGYRCTIIKNNTVRDAGTAYDLPAAVADSVVVEDNLSGSGLT